MPKLTKDVGDYCLSHVDDNELVVMPESHDTGFDEYIAMKIDGVYKGLSTRKRKDECHLEISYPRPGANRMEFASFFDTPFKFAKDRRFQGLLTIDVTAYALRYNSEDFAALITFLREDLPGTRVLFVLSTDSFQKAKGISEKLRDEMDAVTTYLSLPTKERLLLFLRDKMREKNLFDERREEISRAIVGAGFEVAEGIEKALRARANFPESKRKKSRSVSFGY